MALGYEIGTIMQRTSDAYSSPDGKLTVKIDRIVGMERSFVQIQGRDRAAVEAAGTGLGLEGTYLPHSYIELVQLENLTQSFQTVTEDLKRRFAVNGEPLVSGEHVVGSLSRGSSPMVPYGGSFTRIAGFSLSSPQSAPPLSQSAPVAVRVSTPAAAQSKTRQGLLSRRMHAAAHAGGGDGSSASIESSAILENGNAEGSGIGVGERIDRSSSSGGGGSSTPDGVIRGGGGGTAQGDGSGSRPGSPSGSTDMRRLMQTQALLTSQMEELTLQLSLAQAHMRQQQSDSPRQQDWRSSWTAPVACAAAGAAVGMVLATIVLRPGGRA